METKAFWKPETFEELALYWLSCHAKARKATSSISRDVGILKKYLLPAFGNCEVNSIDPAKFDFWLASLRRSGSLSPKSCNDVLGLMRKICNDAVFWGFIKVNPTLKIRKFDIPEQDFDFWSHEEVEKFLGYWRKKEPRPVTLWGILIALHTGLRRGEIIGLKWGAVDFEKRMISIKRSYCRIGRETREQTKSKRIRRIPMSLSLAAELRTLRLANPEAEYVTPRCYPDTYLKQFRRLAKEAGVRSIRFHDLRHTFASHFLMKGGNIYDLQKILGHSTIHMTERYAHLVPDYLKDKTEILGY